MLLWNIWSAQNRGSSFLQLQKRTKSTRRTISVDINSTQMSPGAISSITPEGRVQEYGARVFLVVFSKRSRDNRQELQLKRFSLNIRKHFFYWWWLAFGTGCTERLQRGCVVFLIRDTQKLSGHSAQHPTLRGSASPGALDQMTSCGAFQPQVLWSSDCQSLNELMVINCDYKDSNGVYKNDFSTRRTAKKWNKLSYLEVVDFLFIEVFKIILDAT